MTVCGRDVIQKITWIELSSINYFILVMLFRKKKELKCYGACFAWNHGMPMKKMSSASTPKKIIFIASLAESLINFRLHLIKEFLARQYSVAAIAPYDEKVAQALSALGVKFISLPLE